MAARAGFCAQCDADVWLKDGGGCIAGHAPQSVRSARAVPLPPELDKFNWGAFFFPVLWPLVKGPGIWAAIFFGLGFVERLIGQALPSEWWPFLVVLAVADLALTIWYARNANRLLWETSPWKVDPGGLAKAQRTWGIVGASLAGGLLLVGVAAAVAVR